MKTSKVVWKLVVLAFVVVFDPILVQGKRQKPRHDEIERFINDTHSFIWKCSTSECHPGLGLNVQCGTSIPISTRIECVACVKGVNYSDTQDYSTCKSCKNCGKHENKKGECTPEEDRTECLGTCFKGFYMDKITGDCHPCSDCCGMTLAKKHHEKQCEDAGLPPQQQCRQTNVKCHHPSKADSERKDPQPEKQGSLQAVDIVAVVVSVPIGVFIIVFLVLWRCYGWEQVKLILKKCCCCLCHLVQSTRGNTFNFHRSDQGDLESAFCNVSGSRLTEDGDVLGTLSSDAFIVWTTEKRPVFQRLLSAPVETRSNFKLKIIPRSFSDPGCLNGLDKTQKMSNFLSGSGNLLLSAGTKKRTKKGYTLVETEPPEIDDLLIGENLGKDISSGELIGNSLQSGDVVAQVPGMETPVPTELPEHDYLPANNLCKDVCVIQPTFSGAFPGNPLQSAVCKDQRLEKPSAKDQCTSTTGLHLSSTTQVADIPQDFLDSLLSKSISAIPIKFYRKICNGLDILRQCFWDDYRMLAEKVGLDKDDTLWLGQNGNPTELILQKFNSQKNSSIGRFKEILEQMQRDDIVTIIKEWVVDEWNNNNCGKGYKLKSFV